MVTSYLSIGNVLLCSAGYWACGVLLVVVAHRLYIDILHSPHFNVNSVPDWFLESSSEQPTLWIRYEPRDTNPGYISGCFLSSNILSLLSARLICNTGAHILCQGCITRFTSMFAIYLSTKCSDLFLRLVTSLCSPHSRCFEDAAILCDIGSGILYDIGSAAHRLPGPSSVGRCVVGRFWRSR